MKKITSSPILPFLGNKKNFLKVFLEILENSDFVQNNKESDLVFVDLFGGSGLLSENLKRRFPNSRVIYNDFENYSERLKNIVQTEELRKEIFEKITYKYNLKDSLKNEKENILKIIENHKNSGKYFDEKSFLAWLRFSGQANANLEEIQFYNKIPKNPLKVENNYLENVEIVSMDYGKLIKEILNTKTTVFLFDPPYLNTQSGHYKIMESWDLKDFLDICLYLENRNFIFFTSEKSSMLEFIGWLNENKVREIKNFKITKRINAPIWNGKYEDIMIYNI